MFEIRITGRGGQGVSTLARILSRTALISGFYSSDLTFHSLEMREQPVMSYARFDKKPFELRGPVEEPDCVIVLDDSLDVDSVLTGLKEDGFVIINSNKPGSKFKPKTKAYAKTKFFSIDATDIAVEKLGKNIVSSAMAGAFVKATRLFSMKSLNRAIQTELGEELYEKNREISETGFSKARK